MLLLMMMLLFVVVFVGVVVVAVVVSQLLLLLLLFLLLFLTHLPIPCVLPLTPTQLRSGPNGKGYINASHVGSDVRPRAYIASQAPPPQCIGDFWQMIFEQEVTVIVMLTGWKIHPSRA